MHALYGKPPAELASPPSGAVQCSPLLPGAVRFEDWADGALGGVTLLAPRGTLERRFALAHLLRACRAGGEIVVLAPNKQGGARLADELVGFGCAPEVISKRHHRICHCRRPDDPVGLGEAIAAGALQRVDTIGLWSQPGVFSWDRVDPGSALLIRHLPRLVGRGADLGCGIGVLARAVLEQPAVAHLVLVDHDRRAIEAARRNVEPARTTVAWADVTNWRSAPKDLDFVVMNPPFHDAGADNPGLGRAFIRAAAGMLRPGGVCLLTANRHLPYEAEMKSLFAEVQPLAQDEGFKIYAARK